MCLPLHTDLGCSGCSVRWTAGPPYLQVLCSQIQPATDGKYYTVRGWLNSRMQNPQKQRADCKGFEYPRILVSMEVLEPIPCGYRETTAFVY